MHEIVSFSKEIEFKNMINKITSISLEHTLMLVDSSNIKGDFIVSGSYKMTVASQLENDFSYKIPVDIEVDDKYDLSNLVIDIDDFTYEVIDEEILKVNIDLLLDKLELREKKVVVERAKEEVIDDLVKEEDLFAEVDDVKDLTIKGDDDIEILDINDDVQERKIEDFHDDIEDKIDEVFSEEKKEEKIEEIVLVENNKLDSVEVLDSTDASSLFASFDSSHETYSTYSVYVIRTGDSLEDIMSKYKVSREMLEEYNDLSSLKIGMKLIIPSVKDE